MSHTPPVPQGNQSPYPVQEPPHAPVATALPAVASDDAEASPKSLLADLPLATIGTAVGIGVALIGGVLLGLRGLTARTEPRRRGRGKRR